MPQEEVHERQLGVFKDNPPSQRVPMALHDPRRRVAEVEKSVFPMQRAGSFGNSTGKSHANFVMNGEPFGAMKFDHARWSTGNSKRLPLGVQICRGVGCWDSDTIKTPHIEEFSGL